MSCLLDTITELLVAISNGSESSCLLTQLINHLTTMTAHSNDALRDQLARLLLLLLYPNNLMHPIGKA